MRQINYRSKCFALSPLITAAILLVSANSEASAQAATGQDTAWKPAINNVVKKDKLPSGFVYLDEVIPEAQYQISYYGKYNFTGAPVSGYKAPLAISTSKAANALKKVSEDLSAKGYILRIYDAYRPQKAVNRFVAWSQDASDVINKQLYYPELDKKNLFKLGFISKKSGHSRGARWISRWPTKKRAPWLIWAARMIFLAIFLIIILHWSTLSSIRTAKS